MRHRALIALSAVCIASFVLADARSEVSTAQAARLAELRPESVGISRGSDFVFIRGGDLGRFDASASAVENLRKLIVHLGLLHDAARSAEFSVTEQTPTFVRYVQLIGGVPVSARNEVDLGSAGRILEARLSVVDPARAPKAQPMTRERATQLASLAYAAQAGVAAAEVQFDGQPGLHYKSTALGEPLKLQYRFAAWTAGRSADYVTVDAFTGAVDIASAALD
jgi:hypothetical protein